MASGIFFDADGNDETMEVLTRVVEEDDVKERKLWAEIDAVAEDIIQFNTGGLCHLGIVCDSCDCFLTSENIKDDARRHRSMATHILEQIRKRHGVHG